MKILGLRQAVGVGEKQEEKKKDGREEGRESQPAALIGLNTVPGQQIIGA